MKSNCIKILIVVGSHLAHIVSIGMCISFGILYSEIRADFNTSHSEAAWIVSIFSGLIGLVGLTLGFLLHKTGERWLTVAGTILLSAGMITSSFASRISTIYITYGLISGIGAGTVHYCANTIVVRHFSAKWCPLAVTLANSGSAVSSLILPPILTACIQAYSWKTTFMVLGGISAVSLISAACFVPPQKEVDDTATDTSPDKENNDNSGKKTEVTDTWKMMTVVLQNCRFMVFFVSSVTTFTVVFCPATFLPDLMRDARYNPQEISWCVMIMGFGNLIGRLISGTFASKFNSHVPWIHGITLLGFAATTTLTITSQSLTSLIVLSALLGLFSGGHFGLHMAVVAHYLKRSQIPVGFGMIVAANGVSSTAGVPLAGLVSDAFDGEKGSFVFGGCVMFIAALVLSVNMVKEFFVRWTSDVEAKDEYNVEVHYENEITHL